MNLLTKILGQYSEFLGRDFKWSIRPCQLLECDFRLCRDDNFIRQLCTLL